MKIKKEWILVAIHGDNKPEDGNLNKINKFSEETLIRAKFLIERWDAVATHFIFSAEDKDMIISMIKDFHNLYFIESSSGPKVYKLWGTEIIFDDAIKTGNLLVASLKNDEIWMEPTRSFVYINISDSIENEWYRKINMWIAISKTPNYNCLAAARCEDDAEPFSKRTILNPKMHIDQHNIITTDFFFHTSKKNEVIEALQDGLSLSLKGGVSLWGANLHFINCIDKDYVLAVAVDSKYPEFLAIKDHQNMWKCVFYSKMFNLVKQVKSTKESQ